MTYLLSFFLVNLFFCTFYNAPAYATSPEVTYTVIAPGPSPTLTVACNTDGYLSSLCPTCDGSIITSRKGGRWAVYCERQLLPDHTNSGGQFLWNFTKPPWTVEQCIGACRAYSNCIGLAIVPAGLYYSQCLIRIPGQLEHGPPDVVPAPDARWTVLLPVPDTYGIAQVYGSFCQRLDLASAMTCPGCNNTSVDDTLGFMYRVFCESQWVSSSESQVLDFDLPRCMIQCEDTSQYKGITFSRAGCELAFGDESHVQGSAWDHTAFLLNPTNVRAPSRPTSTVAAMPCHASSLSCPACANAYVKDDRGKMYHVLCDSSLYSERFYSVPHHMTPESCMLECDSYTWCGGANFQSPGNCELAKGQDVFPQESLGSTAFLSVDLSYTQPPPQLSAFPTGAFSSVRGTSVRSSSLWSSSARSSSTRADSLRSTSTRRPSPKSSSTRSTSAAPAASPCSLNSVQCRQCNGARVVDGLKETYRVQCNFQPICNDISSRTGHSSQSSCLEHCDADATCLAAIWNNGQCDLCQGSLEGLATYESARICGTHCRTTFAAAEPRNFQHTLFVFHIDWFVAQLHIFEENWHDDDIRCIKNVQCSPFYDARWTAAALKCPTDDG